MNTNRTKGHNWERKVINFLRPLFPSCCSSRAQNLADDAKKIDLQNTGVFKIQCKATKNINVVNTLNSIEIEGDEDIPVVFYKNTKVSGKKGEVVVLRVQDFLTIIGSVKTLL